MGFGGTGPDLGFRERDFGLLGLTADFNWCWGKGFVILGFLLVGISIGRMARVFGF